MKRYPPVSVGTVFRDPVHWLAFGFGSGLLRPAPGTWGTLAAVPLYLLLVQLPFWAYLVVVVASVAVGVWLCGESARRLHVHDHPGIVWDEFAGFWITMLAAPAGWVWIGIGFVLFRLFDAAKPWPIRWLDRRVPGGLGIMIDDVLAGIFALAGLQLVAWGWARYAGV
ncbi:MAG TPA: phosphatidylglycerophosphatase A [Thioalkalivibrio sp.]|nr:phosphatidylglycerophosphatase A [Thioalkalivibrio sp.]